MAKVPLLLSMCLLGACLAAENTGDRGHSSSRALLRHPSAALGCCTLSCQDLAVPIPERSCAVSGSAVVWGALCLLTLLSSLQDGDQCNPNPCKNGATCKDQINSYVCWCPAGYEGKNCEIDFTCAIKNGGCKHFCSHQPPQKVVCSCAPGYKLHEDGKSCEPTVPYPCGRITAPEAKRKLTRSMNTFEHWNITGDDPEDGPEEVQDNATESSTAAPMRITPVLRTGTRVVGGSDSMKGEVPWQVLLVNSQGLGFCGASIINEKWVVTAAHCLKPGYTHNLTAVAGEH
ncbi:FA9 factor, partial [Hypocryptadius cinnamomeus]|nr:FA9 factor [Hypocryptadius cinnamomeus]